jgi:hypothetical protein
MENKTAFIQSQMQATTGAADRPEHQSNNILLSDARKTETGGR